MTNEEAKEIIIKERDSLKANPIVIVEDCLYEAFDVAIKALEQQPCENAISRRAVNTLIDELARRISDERCHTLRGRSTEFIMRDILVLPSVTPQPKTGYWVRRLVDYNKCSKCGEIVKFYHKYNYCPHCGARMSESEDEEKIIIINDVLDKIKAEIDGLLNDEDNHIYAHGVMDCLEILDKYKEESKVAE